jgi:hypothetical protein
MDAYAIIAFVIATTAQAFEVLGPHEAVHCVCCGSPLKNVFVTESGPMGGDCLATKTGDNSTRVLFRKISKKLGEVINYHDIRVQGLHIKDGWHGKKSLIATGPTSRSYIDEWSGEYENIGSKLIATFDDTPAAHAIAASVAEVNGLALEII